MTEGSDGTAFCIHAVEDDMNEEQQGTLGFISRMGT